MAFHEKEIDFSERGQILRKCFKMKGYLNCTLKDAVKFFLLEDFIFLEENNMNIPGREKSLYEIITANECT